MAATLSASERAYLISGLAHSSTPTRLDSRSLLTPRPISISYGDAPQASGSARVVIDDGTEVIAGIRLEVKDVDPNEKGKRREGWRTEVEVDVTPQAYPFLDNKGVQTLSTLYAAIIADHFIPSIPVLPILPPTKYFVPQLQLTLLSASSGCVPTALLLAARSAFIDLKIPRTKRIGWEGNATTGLEEGEGDLSGIKAAVRAGGKGKGRKVIRGGDEWDLDNDMGDDGLDLLSGREELPVLVTLNLIPGSDKFFIDATPQEEAACPDRIHLFFGGNGKVCGIRTEGTDGFDAARLKALMVEGKRIALELIQSLNAQIPQH